MDSKKNYGLFIDLVENQVSYIKVNANNETLKRLKQIESEFDEIFWSGNSFEDLFETFNYNQNDPKSKIF